MSQVRWQAQTLVLVCTCADVAGQQPAVEEAGGRLALHCTAPASCQAGPETRSLLLTTPPSLAPPTQYNTVPLSGDQGLPEVLGHTQIHGVQLGSTVRYN